MLSHLLGSGIRCFSTSCFAGHSIPGLKIITNFLKNDERTAVQSSALQLHQHIINQNSLGRDVPCRTFLSKQHNLSSDESYRIVKLEDGEKKQIKGLHFDKYSETGHRLTYFIGNDNIPNFVRSTLISRFLEMPEINRLVDKDIPLKWNFTFNSYAPTRNNANQLSGFEFHKDVASNGLISMIYSIGMDSIFEMRFPDQPTRIFSFPLAANSCLFLMDEARWIYEHRVSQVNCEAQPSLLESSLESIKRVSLVLGCLR
ncbi:MAG: hypothetical protein ACHQUC_08155 [Chlamydiales bacterium]